MSVRFRLRAFAQRDFYHLAGTVTRQNVDFAHEFGFLVTGDQAAAVLNQIGFAELTAFNQLRPTKKMSVESENLILIRDMISFTTSVKSPNSTLLEA